MPPMDLTHALQNLVRIGLALARETNLTTLLDRTVTEARWLTHAEAGTLYLIEEGLLHFTVVQNDRLARELGAEGMRQCLAAEPLRLDEPSLAAHVALTGDVLNLHDPHMIPPDRPYAFNASVDARCQYRTQSVLAVPLPDPTGKILGVLQLINALDRDGNVIPFDSQYEGLLRDLAAQAAVAIRNARLEELALKDDLTEAYSRRYLVARLEEECGRFARVGAPAALVLLDLDRFQAVIDREGRATAETTLQEVARLLLRHSRSFTVVSRYGANEFGALLVSTSKAGALRYAERIRQVIEAHPLPGGPLTASLGVAALPEDATDAEALMRAAEGAVQAAKRLGRNRVAAA